MAVLPRSNRASLVAVLAALSSVAALLAQVPLQPALREARSAYISLEGADMRAMDELAKHWRQTLPSIPLVASPAEADVIVTVQKGPSGTGYGWMVGGVLGTSGTQAWRMTIRAKGGGDAEPLYSDSEVIGDFSEYGGIRNLVRRLKTRLNGR